MNERTGRDEELTIDTASLLNDLKRHWWNILLMFFAGALLALVFALNFSGRTYKSDTILAVLGTSGGAAANVQNATKFSESITSVFQSDALRSLISQDVGSTNYSMSVSYIEDTNLVSISASASTPRLAFRALESALRNYPKLLSNLMSDLYLVTVQQPTIAEEASRWFSTPQFAVLGACSAAFAYVCVVLLFSVLRDTVKNTSDMRRKVDGRLLGKIPYTSTLKKAKDNFVLATSQSRNFQFEENFQLITSRILTHLDRSGGKTLAVTSVLQNEGKTHCLLNIAYSIAKSQKRVLVIDADFRNPSVAKVLKIEQADDAALAKAIQTGGFEKGKLYQIPDSRIYCLVNTSKQNALGRSLSNGKFSQLLHFAGRYFDYILVDTGPVALVADTSVIAAQCDASVLLVAQDTALVRAINDAIDVLDRNGTLIGCIYRETRSPVVSMGTGGYGASYRYGYGSDKSKSKEIQ